MTAHFQEDSSFERILSFLREVDSEFTPSLSSRVDLEKYAEKLSTKALNVFGIKNGEDIGHAAVYFSSDSAFISSFAVIKSARGIGQAHALIDYIVEATHKRGLNKITLEVSKSNYVALKFYAKHGFETHKVEGDSLILGRKD